MFTVENGYTLKQSGLKSKWQKAKAKLKLTVALSRSVKEDVTAQNLLKKTKFLVNKLKSGSNYLRHAESQLAKKIDSLNQEKLKALDKITAEKLKCDKQFEEKLRSTNKFIVLTMGRLMKWAPVFNKNGILGVTLLLFLFIVLPIVSLIVVVWYNFVHTYMKFEYIVSILWRTLVCGICMISFVIEYAEMLGRYNHPKAAVGTLLVLTILYMFSAILEVASLDNDSLWSTKAAVVEYFCMLYMVGTMPFCISKFEIDTKLAALSLVFIALPGLVLYHHVKLDDLYSSQTEVSIALNSVIALVVWFTVSLARRISLF